MNKVIEEISKIGIVPVIALDRVEDARPLAQALIDGGLPCAEVTFRTAAAEEAIKIMVKEFPELLVGAGTVLTIDQADRAINAGAKFIVSPGLNPKVVEYVLSRGIPMVPGTANASDIEAAMEFGLDIVKFFPAENLGGIKMIKSLAAPYVNMKFMPTGGVNADNVTAYLDYEKIVACGGTWMIDKALIKAGDFKGIEGLVRKAVNAMLGLKIKSSSGALGAFFDNGNDGTVIETNYMDRAVYHLARRGIKFDLDNAEKDAKGKIVAVKVIGENIKLVQK